MMSIKIQNKAHPNFYREFNDVYGVAYETNTHIATLDRSTTKTIVNTDEWDIIF